MRTFFLIIIIGILLEAFISTAEPKQCTLLISGTLVQGEAQ